MTLHADIFVASDADLTDELKTWRVPLVEPVQRPGRNPFTGETIMVPSWDPMEGTSSGSQFGGHQPSGPHPLVSKSPHWSTESVDTFALRALFRVLDRDAAQGFPGRPARVPPRGSNFELHELPPRFVRVLSALQEDKRPDVAARWAEELNDPAETWQDTTERLVSLAKTAVDTGMSLYILIEW